MTGMIKEKTIEHIKQFYNKKERLVNPTGYFYDLSMIRNNIKILEDNLPKQVKLYYAMKANSHKSVMKCIREMDFVKGIEIASSGELETAIHYYENQNIIFTGPGKTEYELEQAIKKSVRFINVESVVEAVRIDNIARRLNIRYVEILLRINLNYFVEDTGENISGWRRYYAIKV